MKLLNWLEEPSIMPHSVTELVAVLLAFIMWGQPDGQNYRVMMLVNFTTHTILLNQPLLNKK
ncbi:hypothetical protein Hanom_Chr12g01108431 [Helianthus anomalus]